MFKAAKSRRGAAAVEFAIVAPLFFFAIIFPMIEFGRAMSVLNGVAFTAEAGCRTGALPDSSNSDINTAVTNNLTALGIGGADRPEVKVFDEDGNLIGTEASVAMQGDSISVTVSVPYANVTWLPGSLVRYLGNKKLSSTEVMRRE